LLWQVPATVGLKFMGVPEEEIAKYKGYTLGQILLTWGWPPEDEQQEIADLLGRYWQDACRLVERLKEDPSGEGWVQYVIRVQQEDPDLMTTRSSDG
jgi:hypothetical protein